MSPREGHYEKTVAAAKGTKFTRCGYADRFDPFRLANVPRLRDLYAHLFASFLGDVPIDRVLDIGCGTGIYFEALAAHGRHIHVMDASSAMLGVTRAFCRDRGLDQMLPVAGAAESLPYADGTFDAVLALDTLHHVDSVDTAVNEVYRVLKPGGRFFVFEPNILNPLMWCAHALPREERHALRRNRPAILCACLESRFDRVCWQGIPELITETTGVRRRLLDAYLGLCRFSAWEALYPRQAWLGVKPERSSHDLQGDSD